MRARSEVGDRSAIISFRWVTPAPDPFPRRAELHVFRPVVITA